MILHTLNAGPSSTAFKDCLPLLTASDALLLTGDGVYCAATGTDASRALIASGAALYVLSQHSQARGVSQPDKQFTAIDMSQFVELTERFAKQLAWY